MKFKTFTYPLLIVLLQCLWIGDLSAQISIGFSEQPQEINVCGADSLSYFTIKMNGQTDLDAVQIRMPKGIHYVEGSLQVVSGSGLALTESDLSTPNQPVFIPDGNVEGSATVDFTILKRGKCDAIESDKELAEDTISVMVGDSVVVEESSSSYNISYAALSIEYVSPTARDTVVNDLPSEVCRDIKIRNGGFGYLSTFRHRVTLAAGIENYQLKFNGTVLDPIVTDGNELVYEFVLDEAPFAGEAFENDLLENGDELTIEECFVIGSCDVPRGQIRHASFWGCGDDICETSNVINGNVQYSITQPDLRSEVVFRDNVLCMDGQDAGIVRMRVWNAGSGAAVLNRLRFEANGGHTALLVDEASITYEDDDISEYFSNVRETTNSSLSCGSDVTGLVWQSEDFSSSFQLAPGEEVIVEMKFVMCCPGSCGNYTLANPRMYLRGTDLCGGNSQEVNGTADMGGSASVADPIVSGNSILTNGQVERFCVEYPNYTFLNTDPDSSYVSFVVGAPAGLTFPDAGTSTVTVAGSTINIASAQVVGDELIVHVLKGNMPTQSNAPLEFCFDVMPVCEDGFGGLASLTLGQTTSIDDCDPSCLIKLNCSEHDILLFDCGEGVCDNGGGSIVSYEVQRVTYGLENPVDDRNWETWNKADSSAIDLKRVLIGDTIRHQATLAFSNGGSNNSWDGATFTETYTHGADGWLCPDTAWVVIKGENGTYSVGGLMPTPISTGFTYDLSNEYLQSLPGGSNVPDAFTSSDTLYLRTKYGFCIEKASDWYSNTPGVYQSNRTRQNVIFTGDFKAKAVNDDEEHSCGYAMYDELLFLGGALSVEIKDGGFVGDGCDRDFRYLFEVRQNIGGVLSGFSGTYDFFPNEFRGLYIPDSIVVDIPEDVTFKNARLITQQIENVPPTPGQATVNKEITPYYEDDSRLIFHVRDVHDAFGGDLFPYDEENADLRYFIEFQRNCATGRSITTDLSISYTTPLEPGEEFEITEEGLTTGTNSDLSNIDLIQHPEIKPAVDQTNCVELEVRPRGGKLSYTWLKFVDSVNAEILSVSIGGTVLTAEEDGTYHLGDHANNSSKRITICVQREECGDGRFEVLFGWDCNGYPGEKDYIGACEYKTVTFYLEEVEEEIQFNLTQQPGRDPTSGKYPELCDELMYEVVFNSSKQGNIYEPRMMATLPVGFEVDRVEIQYPRNSGTWEVIPHTSSGNMMEVDAYTHSAMVHDSLPGLEATTSVNPRQMAVRLYGYTDCYFRSGSRLIFTSLGDKSCGGPAEGSGSVRGSDRLIIEGLEPYTAEPVVSVDVDLLECGVATAISVNYTVEGGDFVGKDTSIITLSPGLSIVDGSLECEDGNCPNIEKIIPDPNNPGGTLIVLSYPEDLEAGTEVNLTFEVMAEGAGECGEEVFVVFENRVTIDNLECNGEVCSEGVSGITGIDSLMMQVIRPELNFDNLVVETAQDNPNVEYSGQISVSQNDLREDDSFYVKVYCADASGQPVGEALDSVLLSGAVAAGGTIAFEGYFLKTLCDLEHGLVATTGENTGCYCAGPEILQPEIEELEEYDPGVALSKEILSEPEPTGNINEFVMSYEITVTDTTGHTAYYDLSDTIQYGQGAEFVSATVEYGSGDNGLQTTILTPNPTDTAFLIVENEQIRNEESDSYIVTVVFTIDPNEITEESADCDYTNDDGNSSGLTNVAVIDGAVPVDRDTACAEIPVPGLLLSKEVVDGPSPVDGSVNGWVVTYEISVEDTTGIRAFYNLRDSVSLGLGATLDSVMVSYTGDDGLQTSLLTEVTTDPEFDIVKKEYVEELQSDVYEIVVYYTLDPNQVTDESTSCDFDDGEGNLGGLVNVAVIDSLIPTDRDTVCTEIPVPGVRLTKSIVSEPVPAGTKNEFVVVYAIAVEDTTGVRAYYNLSDTLKYGNGLDFVSAEVTYGGDGLNSSILDANPSDTAFQIVQDEWIEDFAVDSYYVAVTYKIDPNVVTKESADCDYTNDNGFNSGLTNVTVIYEGVPEERDTVCTEAPIPGVILTKTLLSDPQPTGNYREFTMTYVLAVEDTTGVRAYYDLTDEIQYGQGATFKEAYITYGGTDGLQTGILNDNPTTSPYQIVDDEYVEDFGIDSFYVEVIFEIDPYEITEQSKDCDYESSDGENGGLRNVAMIDDGIPVARDTACASIPDPEIVIEKVITNGPTMTGNSNNPFEYILEYEITVEDLMDFTSFYDLGDTLKFASSATITSIEVTYTGDHGLQTGILDPNPSGSEFAIVKDEEIGGLQTDRYHVTVIFEVDPLTYDASAAKCKDGVQEENHGLKNVAGLSGSVKSQQDSVCTEVPPPCLDVNCHAYVSLGFGLGCDIEVTPDILLIDNRLALIAPEYYKVELFYGPGIPIPDNILREKHVGREITARVTLLLDVCGNGTCETTIVLDRVEDCIIENPLDTVVYCVDPLLQLDPWDPGYPKPTVLPTCSGFVPELKVSPDWVKNFDCDNDTAQIIYRQWYAETIDGKMCTATDTIVVMRLPKLTAESFLGEFKNHYYCELHGYSDSEELNYEYASWKQPVGIGDYELPAEKLGHVVYHIPGSIIHAGLANACAQGGEVLSAYLETVIVKYTDGNVVRVRDIVDGSYMAGVIGTATPVQQGYGILQLIYDGLASPYSMTLSCGSYSFYEYVLLPLGSEVMSENGSYERVGMDWFYNGTGNAPYWFSGGWPSVYGSGTCVSYCDAGESHEFECISIVVPSLTSEGYDLENCDTICLTADGMDYCGLRVTQELSEWTGDCTKERVLETKVVQTCWADVEVACEGGDGEVGDDCLVAEYNDNEECCDRVSITLRQMQVMHDELPPIFEFCYSTDWDQEAIKSAISNGVQAAEALEWERRNPTVYTTSEVDCSAEVYIPSVTVTDNCSGIQQMKAVFYNYDGGPKAIELELTSVDTVVMSDGLECVHYTYSHEGDPIRLPFRGCGEELLEVVYEASDGCWNRSSWSKFIQIRDDVPPTAVANHDVRVTMNKSVEWASAARTYDQGSWDNCALGLMLVRRADWSESGLIDLCSDVSGTYDSWGAILTAIGFSGIEVNSAVSGVMGGGKPSIDLDKLDNFLNGNEIEQYYLRQIKNLWTAEGCGEKVVHGWLYDIARVLGANCGIGGLSETDLALIFDHLFGEWGYGHEVGYIGGGWGAEAPFTCEDACGLVVTDLLVTDYCCNVSIISTETYVEDRSEAQVLKSLGDVTISCEAYNMYYKEIVEAAEGGSFEALNAVFGGYVVSGVDSRNRPVTDAGELLSESDLEFMYRNVSCVERGSGSSKETVLDTVIHRGSHGIVGISCSGSYHQTISVEMDVCGQGVITRRFYVVSGCGEDATSKEIESQVIRIESACAMRESMFDTAPRLGTVVNPVCLPSELEEGALFDTIGGLTMKPHLEGRLCNTISISHEVSRTLLTDYPDLVQYIITWKATDWCCAEELPEREYIFTQKVIAKIDPECTLNEGGGDISLVSGKVITELGSPVEDVHVRAVTDAGTSFEFTTSGNGQFGFSLPRGSGVSIIPSLNLHFSHGVTTQDLIAIQRHILGKETLGSKYQRIAADVNGNGVIDVYDILELRKNVLNPSSIFSNNTSWRFFEKESGKESYEISALDRDQRTDFIGVKIGDVNQSGDPANVSRRATGVLHLDVTDRELKGGETYRVDVRSDNFADVAGMQFTMSYAEGYVSVESIEAGALRITADNYLRYGPGLITSSWNDAEGLSVSAEDVLFTIVLKAKSGVRLRDVLSVNSRVTKAEAYSGAELKDVRFRFGGGEDGYVLHQNVPNPYKGETKIGFELPESSVATLTIYDVKGKMIHRIEGDYEAGYNEVRLRSADLGTTGVMYYQLDTDRFTATKKMIVVE